MGPSSLRRVYNNGLFSQQNNPILIKRKNWGKKSIKSRNIFYDFFALKTGLLSKSNNLI